MTTSWLDFSGTFPTGGKVVKQTELTACVETRIRINMSKYVKIFQCIIDIHPETLATATICCSFQMLFGCAAARCVCISGADPHFD